MLTKQQMLAELHRINTICESVYSEHEHDLQDHDLRDHDCEDCALASLVNESVLVQNKAIIIGNCLNGNISFVQMHEMLFMVAFLVGMKYGGSKTMMSMTERIREDEQTNHNR